MSFFTKKSRDIFFFAPSLWLLSCSHSWGLIKDFLFLFPGAQKSRLKLQVSAAVKGVDIIYFFCIWDKELNLTSLWWNCWWWFKFPDFLFLLQEVLDRLQIEVGLFCFTRGLAQSLPYTRGQLWVWLVLAFTEGVLLWLATGVIGFSYWLLQKFSGIQPFQ